MTRLIKNVFFCLLYLFRSKFKITDYTSQINLSMKNLLKVFFCALILSNTNILFGLDCQSFQDNLKLALKNSSTKQEITPELMWNGLKNLIRMIKNDNLYFDDSQKEEWKSYLSLDNDPQAILDRSCNIIEGISASSNDEGTKEELKNLINKFTTREEFEEYRVKVRIKDRNTKGYKYLKEVILVDGWHNYGLEKYKDLSYAEVKKHFDQIFEEIISKSGYLKNSTGKYYDRYLYALIQCLDSDVSYITIYNDRYAFYNKIPCLSRASRSEINSKILESVSSASGKQYKVGVVKIGSLGYGSLKDLANILPSFNESVDVLVIDIRGCESRDVDGIVRTINMFLDKPTTVGVVKNQRKPTDVELIGTSLMGSDESLEQYNKLFTKPVVVLIDPNSTRTNEVFAGAIQDLGRGIVVGGLSFGAGHIESIEEVNLNNYIDRKNFSSEEEKNEYIKKYSLDEQVYLVWKSQKFYRFNGESIERTGVTPDIIIPRINYCHTPTRDQDGVNMYGWNNYRRVDDNEIIDPLDPSKYDHYNLVDDYLAAVKSKFELRKNNNDPNLRKIKRFVRLSDDGGSCIWDVGDSLRINQIVLDIATDIAADYVEAINEKK